MDTHTESRLSLKGVKYDLNPTECQQEIGRVSECNSKIINLLNHHRLNPIGTDYFFVTVMQDDQTNKNPDGTTGNIQVVYFQKIDAIVDEVVEYLKKDKTINWDSEEIFLAKCITLKIVKYLEINQIESILLITKKAIEKLKINVVIE